MDIRQGTRRAVQHSEVFMAAIAVALSWLVVVVVVMLALTSPAQAQDLASYTNCAAAERAGARALCPSPARDEQEAFLRWAVALHRAAVSDSRARLRTVGTRSGERIPSPHGGDADPRLLAP